MLIRRRTNHIELFRAEDGRWVEGQFELKDLAIDYFKDMYRANPAANDEFIVGTFPLMPENLH